MAIDPDERSYRVLINGKNFKKHIGDDVGLALFVNVIVNRQSQAKAEEAAIKSANEAIQNRAINEPDDPVALKVYDVYFFLHAVFMEEYVERFVYFEESDLVENPTLLEKAKMAIPNLVESFKMRLSGFRKLKVIDGEWKTFPPDP